MSDKIQSVLIEKKHYSFSQAKKLLYEKGFKFLKVHETPNYYRFRQFDPIKGKHYVNKKSNDRGVYYIIMY